MPIGERDWESISVYANPRPRDQQDELAFLVDVPRRIAELHGDTGVVHAAVVTTDSGRDGTRIRRVIGRAPPFHPGDPRPRLVVNPFRIELFCTRDAAGKTALRWAEATTVYPATLRDIPDAAVTLRSPQGGLIDLVGLRRFEPAPEARPACPEGSWTAHSSDPRLGDFAGDRNVTIEYPSGELEVRTLRTAAECARASPRVGERFTYAGAVVDVRGNRACPMFDWKPLLGESFAQVRYELVAPNQLTRETSAALEPHAWTTSVDRPAKLWSLSFDEPGTYDVELAVGRADVRDGGVGYATLAHGVRYVVPDSPR